MVKTFGFVLGVVFLHINIAKAQPTSQTRPSKGVLNGRVTRQGNQTSPPTPLLPPYAPWPDSPDGAKPFQPYANLIPFQLDVPLAGTPEADPVQLNPVPADLKGILLYAITSGHAHEQMVVPLNMPNMKVLDARNDYLVMRAFNISARLKDKEAGSIFYHFAFQLPLREPHVTGDGRLIFVNIGDGSENGGFQPFRWQLKNGKLSGVNHVANASRRRFSPDGSHWAILLPYGYGDESLLPLQKTGWEGQTELEVRDTTHFVYPLTRPFPFWQVTTDAVPRSCAWMDSNTLLFARKGISFPALWSADVRTHKISKLVDKAYDPSPSPDGKYIAFFGWSAQTQRTPEQPSPRPSLWLWNTQSQQAKRVDDQNAGFVRWTPDSKTLIEVRFANDFEARVRVVPLAIALRGTRAVAALPKGGEVSQVVAQDPLHVGPSSWFAPIEVEAISRNGRYLILNLTEYIGVQEPKYIARYTLKAVDLQSGNVFDIATATPNALGSWGWTWFDESDAPSTQSTTR